MTAPKYVCDRCGSQNVQSAIWCLPNDGDRTLDPFGTFGNPLNSYCEDCDEAGRDPHQRLVQWEPPEEPEYEKPEVNE